ncbi:MAG TPA: sigma-54 dependent transcriptional regulator, partial [Polyangiaceae bacterium]|nr:sigma-54 dependent transcriptional regulator [Polyangiaceae bacterium]
QQGLELAAASEPDVVLLDLRLPLMDGLQVLQRLRASHRNLPVIIVTAVGELKTAVEATKLGAFDYLSKPLEHEQLTFAVKRALETRELRVEVEKLRESGAAGPSLTQQMGRSAAVAQIVEQVRTVAETNFSVLILGDTGTGKELVAQSIHRSSERRNRPFVAIDCGAIPENLVESELFGHEKGAFTGAEQRRQGQFRLADGGTLFLDEIGNLPLGLQSKLLRVLESRQLHALGSSRAAPLDVRVLAATNHDLEKLAAAGRFRSDLYFRLAQYTIRLPALRERRADIPYLAQRCLEEASVELRRPTLSIAKDAMTTLQRHDWPGNVRELRNVLRQAVLESSDVTLRAATLVRLLKLGERAPVEAEQGPVVSLRDAARSAARDAERRVIGQALRQAHGNKSQAARLLQTDYKTLYLKMKSLGIRGRDFAP